MKNNLFFTLLLMFSSFFVWGQTHNRLLMVKSISKEKRNFITRQGRFDGIAPGTELIFKAKNVSFTAKATSVSRFYSEWEIMNPHMTIPITPGEYIVAYKGEEYIWAHDDGNIITAKHKDSLRESASWLNFSVHYLRGLSESISNVRNDVEVARNGFGLQGDYYREITKKLVWNVGLRAESETIDIRAGTLKTTRLAFLLGIHYLTNPISQFYNARLLAGLGLGAGLTSTSSASSSQNGSVLVLPAAKFDFLFKINETWSWSAGVGFEALATQETIDNQKQSTDQLNLKIIIGIQRFFGGFSEYIND